MNKLSLYKYLPKNYAQLMIEHGEIQLGTLYHYREMEGLDVARGDAEEGRMLSVGHIDYHDSSMGSSPLAGQGLYKVESGGKIIDSRSIVIINSPNGYVYSLSNKKDSSLHDDFGDTCVEISDAEYFTKRVTIEMDRLGKTKPGQFIGMYKCDYFKGPEINYIEASKTVPWKVKSERFAYQDEFRIFILSNPKGPLIIRMPEIKRVCRIVNLR